MALEPIGVSPFVGLFAANAKLLIAAAAGHQHLVGGHLAIVNRVNYLVSIHIHISISLTHLLYRITLSAKSQVQTSLFLLSITANLWCSLSPLASLVVPTLSF